MKDQGGVGGEQKVKVEVGTWKSEIGNWKVGVEGWRLEEDARWKWED